MCFCSRQCDSEKFYISDNRQVPGLGGLSGAFCLTALTKSVVRVCVSVIEYEKERKRIVV